MIYSVFYFPPMTSNRMHTHLQFLYSYIMNPLALYIIFPYYQDLHIDSKNTNLNLFDNNSSLPYLALDNLKSKYGEEIIRVGIEN